MGAAALIALSVGIALAAASDEEPATPVPSATSAQPSDTGGDTGSDTSGGTSGGVDGGTTSGGTDPDATETPSTPTSSPTGLARPGRDQPASERARPEAGPLPTKQELADALRAFADRLDAPATPTAPVPDPVAPEDPDAS